jgi:beta-glucosidase
VVACPFQIDAPYQEPSQPIAMRVADLVSQMTLEEKVSQMRHTASAIPRLGIRRHP